METKRFLSIYEREQRRLSVFDTERKAKLWQTKDNKVDNQHTEVARLLYTVEALELAYNSSGADNLDFEDQLVMDEYIQALKLAVKDYIMSTEVPNERYVNEFTFENSIEVIEEMITLAYLYLGMQVTQYPAFNRIVRKNYVTNYMLNSEKPSEIEIMNFSKSFAILRGLEPYNRVKARYEKELRKTGRHQWHLQGVDFRSQEEEIVKQLELNLKRIQQRLSGDISRLYSKHLSADMLNQLRGFIHALSEAINHPSNYNLGVLEMMVEIANILCDIPVQNEFAFQILVNNHYMEDHMITEYDLVIKDFEEVYSILLGFKKLL